MTRFITMAEFDSTKIAALDDITYKRIEAEFIKVLGYDLAKRLLARFMEKTVRELSCNNYVDIISAINIY